MYHGPAELTLQRVLTSWTFDPVVFLVITALGGAYLTGVRRVRSRGGSWPAGRTVLFTGLGLGSWALATMSFLGVYADTLFWARAVQVVTLLMITPLLLAHGAPLTLLSECAPRAGRWLRGRVARVLTFPPVGAALLIATPWVLYFTPLYELVLRNGIADAVLRVALVLTGFLYFWARLQLDPVPRTYPHLLSVGFSFAEAAFDGALGITMIFMAHPLASSYYHALARPWGPSLKMDQVIGGGALWMLGDLAGLPFLAALFARMFRQDQADAAEIDRELDAQTAPKTTASGSPEPEMMRPWWETDPILSKRYGTGNGG